MGDLCSSSGVGGRCTATTTADPPQVANADGRVYQVENNVHDRRFWEAQTNVSDKILLCIVIQITLPKYTDWLRKKRSN